MACTLSSGVETRRWGLGQIGHGGVSDSRVRTFMAQLPRGVLPKRHGVANRANPLIALLGIDSRLN